MTRGEIEKAIQRSFDDELGETECRELRAVLKSDPSARALYYEYAGLHQALIYRLSRCTATDTAKSLAKSRLRLQTRRSARIAVVAAAAAVICLGVALRLVFVPNHPPMATMQSAAGSLFTVEHFDQEGDIASDELGEGSTVNLSQGTLEIGFRNGSRAVILAPAAFKLQSEMQILLHRGTAWFQVSANGKGFQVSTPQMIVTDLGTEFGVSSRPDTGDEVHVFSGRVLARSLNRDSAEQSLIAGQARNCDPGGRLTPVPPRSDMFLTRLPSQPSLPGTELLTNGDFEDGAPPDNSSWGSPATAAQVPSWNFGPKVRVALKSQVGIQGYGDGNVTVVSPTGDIQIAFNDNTSNPPAPEDASIWQTIATVPGTKYRVEFEMGAIFFNRRTLQVTASVHDGTDPATGKLLGKRNDSRSPTEGNGYNTPVSFTFTAHSTTSTLIFTETSVETLDADPVIDNISVKAAR